VIRKISRSYLDFYSKDFHPWQHDNREQMMKLKDLYLNE
ncbi:MAG TPA: metal-dependent hydrolase, partial [Acinetobacter sp.]|nr:metal-dependent hydrolase [Acinetobacter sp.]